MTKPADRAPDDDARWMDFALRLGRRALGTTAENPNVGCVIVKDGRVLGVGCTAPGGRPHAEAEALAMAGAAARGATAYVTLEPCAHHGRTPPCAESLIRAGIARAVVAIEDPDPRVSGRGLAMLRAAKVEVAPGQGAAEARRDLAGFLTRIVKSRPYVILKLAVSADGKIAATPGQPTAITGAEARARVHLTRTECDAILVGMGTARADDPALDCRLPGLEQRSPRPFVIGRGALPPESRLAKRGVTVLDPRPGLAAILGGLAAMGLNRLLVEGGAITAKAFLEAGLVDEYHLYRAPLVLGPGGLDAPGESALQPFRLEAQEKLGDDTLSVYVRSP